MIISRTLSDQFSCDSLPRHDDTEAVGKRYSQGILPIIQGETESVEIEFHLK